MVMLTADPSITTVEQLLALPEDDLRHELLRGEHVVTPAPRRIHQFVSAELSRHLGNFTADLHGLTMYYAPCDVRMEENSLVQPDIFVVREDPANPVDEGRDIEVPVLVVEILSPGTASRDRGKKREIYQDAGVAEYWIVDLDSKLIERWRPGDERPEILREKIGWRPDQGGEELEIDLADVFRRVGEK